MATAMSAARLGYWADLDETRSGRASWRGVVVGAVLVAAAVGWLSSRSGTVAASRLWLAAAIAATAPAMLGAPFRLYWRHDSALWARLPIPGGALFDVALVRSIRAAVRAAMIVAPAALVIDVAGPDFGLMMRHLALLATLAVGAALLVPAVALGGGALVAAQKTESLLSAMGGGEISATPTTWLGALPGAAAAGLVLLSLASASWLRGAAETVIGPGAIVLGAAVGASIVAVLAARAAAPRVMPAALREVAALDRQQLAHIEVHPPTGIERAWMSMLPAGARVVFGKDARLMRRRYPLAYVIGVVGVLSQWGLAIAEPDGMLAWSAAIVAGMLVYAVVLSRRLNDAPIEHPVALASLPVTSSEAVLAKRAWVALWIVVYVVVGVVPVLIRAL